jgi:hypothetical protein
MRRMVAIFGLIIPALLLAALEASAARYALTEEYVIDNWQTEDGLPEIDTERTALKALRGDFDRRQDGDGDGRVDRIMQSAQA